MKDPKKKYKKPKKKVIKKPIKKKVNKKATYQSKHVKKGKRTRIRYGRLLLFLLLFFGFIYVLVNYVKIPVRNIIISGNESVTDQEIIDLSGLREYPSVLSFTTNQITSNLEKNIFIDSVKVSKKGRTIIIKVKENYGLFYYQSTKKTVMYNGKEIKEDIDAPLLMNYVTEKVYTLFVQKMKLLNRSIIERISEIKYDPNTVDEERFIFTMRDGNYVYITLEKITSINNYVDIIKTFDDKKGILYLDSGEYFQVFEN